MCQTSAGYLLNGLLWVHFELSWGYCFKMRECKRKLLMSIKFCYYLPITVAVQNYLLHCLLMQPSSFYNRTCCLSYAFRTVPHGSIIYHYLPQQLTSCLQFILINQFLHISPQEKLKQNKVLWRVRPALSSFSISSTIFLAVIYVSTKMGQELNSCGKSWMLLLAYRTILRAYKVQKVLL